MRALAAGGLALLLVVKSAAGATAQPERAPPPVAAVGLVKFRGGGVCSGTLVAPDLVLTAAHCLSGRTRSAEGTVFRTGAYPGFPAVDFAVRDAAVHPFFTAASGERATALGYDQAVLRLAGPVPAAVARPLPVVQFAAQDIAPIVAAFRGDATVRARERRCPVLDREPRVLVLSCPVRKGESGAPMLVTRDGGLAIVGVVAAQSRIGRTEVAVGALAAPLFGALRALIAVPRSP